MKIVSFAITLALSALAARASPLAARDDGVLNCGEGELCVEIPGLPSIQQCVLPDRGVCGGFAGFKCEDPDDYCVDDPRDDCDPLFGGADCIGICVGSGI
ncbi:unnamed protein product [Discula destructiva]